MSVLHITDLHVDHPSRGPAAPNGENHGTAATRRCLTWAVDQAIETESTLLVTGDLWDRANPGTEAFGTIVDAFRRAVNAGCDVIVVGGNHELIGGRAGHRDPAELLGTLGLATVVSSAPNSDGGGTPQIVHTKDGYPVLCVPWPHTVGRDVDDAVKATIEAIGDLGPRAAGGILAGHLQLAEVGYVGSEQGMTVLSTGRDPNIPLAVVDSGPHEIALLGHVHQRQQLGESTLYGGGLNRFDFNDEGGVTGAGLWSPGKPIETLPNPEATVLQTIHAEGFDDTTIIPGALIRLVLAVGDTQPQDEHRKAVASAGAHLVGVRTTPRETVSVARREAETATVADLASRWHADHELGSPIDEFVDGVVTAVESAA